ncbi:MAG: hypothetical protein OEY93_04110 [Anaerolineae bacterium]|nr:hypothetical protein [Anaerolineae bacterium]
MKSKFQPVRKPVSMIISLLMALALAAGVIPAQAAPQQIIVFTDCASSSAFISTTDCNALMDLYTATSGASWKNTVAVNNIWGPGGDQDPCTWYGVTCDTTTKRVTKLILFNNNLNGTLPASIGDLTELTELTLDNNLSLGGTIPASIGNLVNLQYLYLSRDSFTGSIPTQIGNLVSLLDLGLDDNLLSGTIPASIWNMPALEYLFLDGNSLEGSLPPEIGNLPSITYIDLQGNNLSGSIPGKIGLLTKLTMLYLNNNSFSGNIPKSLSNLTMLRYLHLNNNNLDGSIPRGLGKIKTLTSLYLGFNNLTGPIPPELGSLPALVSLNISYNQLSGNLPKELAQATALKLLNVAGNADLSWAVPMEMTSLTPTYFYFALTGLCAPNDPAFSTWWGTITAKADTGLTCDPIFADGFESGNKSAWSGVVGANIPEDAYTAEALCNLCVNKLSAQVNTFGLRVRVANKKPHFLTDTSPTAETRYRARFYVKIKPLMMDHKNNIKILMGRSDTAVPFFVQVRKYGLKYQIRAAIKDNAGTVSRTPWVLLPKKSVPVEIDWMASDNLVTPNGYIELFVDNVSKTSKTGIANDTHVIETVRLGLTTKVRFAFNISGSFLLDGFASDSSTYIGP